MMMASRAKPAGDISSVFSHLGGKNDNIMDEKFVALKKEIAPKDPAVLNNAWERLMQDFEKVSVEVAEQGSSFVPTVSMAEIEANNGAFPPHVAELIKSRGCCVIRGVVPEQEARGYKQNIVDYIAKHPGEIGGFPAKEPQVWEVYWSQAQIDCRSHVNFEKATLALNKLWHADDKTVIDLSKNLGYCDRLRIRKPGNTSFALQEHIDSGSIERWQDPEYRKCYTSIFEGEWEKYDAFDATHRAEAIMDYYNAPGGCSMFRNFQGWVAIDEIQTGSGTLRVCPLLKQSTAYFMMKPLLAESLDSTDFFGAEPGLCQGITNKDYPYIIKNMISMPDVKPGDAVFWHCDEVHSVEPKNLSENDSSVLYIPSSPLCRINSEYVKRQRDAFLNGLTPPDFPGNNYEQNFKDRPTVDTINERAKLNLSLTPFPALPDDATPGQKKALETHNKILGFA